MASSTLLGVLLGGGLGVANAVASILLYRRARSRPSRTFYRLVLGGMLVRMMVVLVTVALVVRLAPVDVSAFIGGLLATFVIGLVVDTALIVKSPVRRDT